MVKIDKYMSKSKSIARVLFYLSLTYYLFWIVVSIYYTFNGIDLRLTIFASEESNIVYGMEAFKSVILTSVKYVVEELWYIPVFQIWYIISSIVLRFIDKSETDEDNEE